MFLVEIYSKATNKRGQMFSADSMETVGDIVSFYLNEEQVGFYNNKECYHTEKEKLEKFKDLIKFVAEEGGLDYYQELLKRLETENINKTDIDEEYESIAALFIVWIEQFEWTESKREYMQEVINEVKERK